MNAGETGVTRGSETGNLLRILQKGNKALALVGEEERMKLLPELEKALKAFTDKVPFQVVFLLKSANFAQFLALPDPTQSLFNQLASEISWCDLLDQIEEACFLQSSAIEKTQPFIAGLWESEVTSSHFKPPAGWKYLPAGEAVEAYRKLFGSNLKADSALKIAKEAKPHAKSEGIAIWPKLSTLAKLFGISSSPLEDTTEGWKAYARIVELFIPEVGKAYTKAYPNFSFLNWREGKLTANHIRLTPAGRKTWQKLESLTDDDFVIAVAGANTGSLYGGYSVRRSRLTILLAGDQFPQDCLMVGGTIATQPDRLTEFKHLGIDCPGTKCASASDGFSRSVYYLWRRERLDFDDRSAGNARRRFGSGSDFLG